ncbi:hypothetical protein WMY93_013958 [Mugilogobius chulae]|uniref:Shugoshin C-terminal domain-containing protein n=1 Tax=Mugilogobius chulae TaxID=88201 RepID=A0AAW0PBJ6_9GOBI
MAPSKVAKQASVAASKVKNKMLNTSSFFKVSLKTNNKALALALAAEKERSRQLEMGIVCLQKQVKELCFDLAVKKYRQRKLFVILNELQNSTLHHVKMVTNLFASDIPCRTVKLRNSNKFSCPPQRPDENLSLSMNDVSHLRKSRSSNMFNVVKDPKSIATPPSPSLESARPSSSLKDEVDRLSMMYALNGYDVSTVLGFQPRESMQNISEKSKPDVLESEQRLEKTIISDSSMELTVAIAPDIDTVGEKTKSNCSSDKKRNGNMGNEAACTSIHKPEEMHTPAFTEIEKHEGCAQDHLKNPKLVDLHKFKAPSKNKLASRIPQMKKSTLTNPEKKEKLKVNQLDVMKTHLPNMDNYFSDVELQSTDASKSVEPMSNINFRRSKTKSQRTSLSRKKTFFIPPITSDEITTESEWAFLESTDHLSNSKSQNQEQSNLKLEDHNKSDTLSNDLFLESYFKVDESLSFKAYENASMVREESTDFQVSSKINFRKTRSKREMHATRKTFDVPPLPYWESNGDKNNANEGVVSKEVKFITDLNEGVCEQEYLRISAQSVGHSPQLSEPESLDKVEAPTKSVKTQKAKCRETFVIGSNDSNPLSNMNNEIASSRGKEDVKPTTLKKPSEENKAVSKTQSPATSHKRSRMSTTDMEENINNNPKVLIDDEANDSFFGFQLPKKARLDNPKPEKKKSIQHEESNKRKKKSTCKKNKKSDHTAVQSRNSFSLLDCHHSDINRSIDNSQLADSLFGSHEDELLTGVQDVKSKMNKNLKQYRKTSKLDAPKNLRETFVVYSNFSSTDMTMQSNEGLVTDEVPPWLDPDAEMNSVLSTPRRETTSKAKECAPSPNCTIQGALSVLLQFFEMGARRLKRDLEALLGDYIGQRIREKSFDPKGKGTSTMLDDLAHYDLAISVALWWLNKEEGRGATTSPQYPNHLEREAMILSSFAGMIMNKLPVEEILALYKCKPAATYSNDNSKAAIVYPFTLSYHPLAMLSSYKAVHHSKMHNDKLKRWLSEKAKANALQLEHLHLPRLLSHS